MRFFPPIERFEARMDAVLRVATLVMLTAGLVLVFFNFLDAIDWDISHEYYYGQRLWYGELIWTREFHDKLPFFQFLMAIPAYFESVGMFQVMSLAGVAAGSAALYALCMGEGLGRRLGVFAAVLFVCVEVALQGRLFNIHPASTGVAFVGMVAIWLGRYEAPSLTRVFWVGLSAAVAISLRPYHMAPLAVTVAWVGVAAAWASPTWMERMRVFCHWTVPWGVAIGLWGFVLNVPPYLFTGQMAAFWEGLGMLSLPTTPNHGLWGYLLWMADLKILVFWAMFVGMAGLAVAGFRKGGNTDGLMGWVLACTAALAFLILQKHSWPGYTQMFAGLLCMMAVVFIARVMKGRMRGWCQEPLQWAAVLVPLTFAALFVGYAGVLGGRMVVHGVPTNEAHEKLSALRGYLAQSQQEHVSFLAPKDMNLHWRLHQPRHGFPHASHTGHIFYGWWHMVTPRTHFMAPATADAYCTLLNAEGPHLFVDPTAEAGGLSCVENPASAYRLETLLPYGNGKVMSVYARVSETSTTPKESIAP